MGNYIQKDNFHAGEFEKKLQNNLSNSRIGWTTTNTISVNEKVI